MVKIRKGIVCVPVPAAAITASMLNKVNISEKIHCILSITNNAWQQCLCLIAKMNNTAIVKVIKLIIMKITAIIVI